MSQDRISRPNHCMMTPKHNVHLLTGPVRSSVKHGSGARRLPVKKKTAKVVCGAGGRVALKLNTEPNLRELSHPQAIWRRQQHWTLRVTEREKNLWCFLSSIARQFHQFWPDLKAPHRDGPTYKCDQCRNLWMLILVVEVHRAFKYMTLLHTPH